MSQRQTKTRNPSVQTVNVAEAIAERGGSEGLLDALADLAPQIDTANSELQLLYDRRLALWREGRERAITHKVLAAASGVTDALVVQTLKRADKALAATG
jgi:hypothetical protein